METDLILLGLIVLENKLKPETTPVISKLKDAKLRIVIVTGEFLPLIISLSYGIGALIQFAHVDCFSGEVMKTEFDCLKRGIDDKRSAGKSVHGVYGMLVAEI